MIQKCVDIDDVTALMPFLHRSGYTFVKIMQLLKTFEDKKLTSNGLLFHFQYEFLMSLYQFIDELKHLVDYEKLSSEYRKEFEVVKSNNLIQKVHSWQQGCVNIDELSTYEKVKRVLFDIMGLFYFMKHRIAVIHLEIFHTDYLFNHIGAIMCYLVIKLPSIISLPDLCINLLKYKTSVGMRFIKYLLVNFPSYWWRVLEAFINQAVQLSSNDKSVVNTVVSSSSVNNGAMDSILYARFMSSIKEIIKLKPDETMLVLETLIRKNQLPDLVWHLSVELHDSGEFSVLFLLKNMLLEDGDTRLWFAAFMRHNKISYYSGQSYCSTLSSKLNSIIMLEIDQIIFLHQSQAANAIVMKCTGDDANLVTTSACVSNLEVQTDEWVQRAMVVLKVLAALRSFVDFVFDERLSQNIISLVTLNTALSRRGIEFITLGLAFCVTFYSSLVESSTQVASIETQFTNWLMHLLKLQEEFYQQNVITSVNLSSLKSVVDNSDSSGFADILLLLAFYFYSEQNSAISDLTNNLLGMKVPPKYRSWQVLKKVFVRHVFTDQVIANQAARVPVTKNLNANISGPLPIQCVIQLLENKSFNKNQVSIKNWIYQQMCNCSAPVHPLIMELLERFAKSITAGISEAISSTQILTLFSCDALDTHVYKCAPISANSRSVSSAVLLSNHTTGLTPQLLMMYYVLMVMDGKSILVRQAKTLDDYNDTLLSSLPVAYLLRYARNYLPQYRILYPHLIKYISRIVPHLVHTEYSIEDELLLDDVWSHDYMKRGFARISEVVTSEQLAIAFASLPESPKSILHQLTFLRLQPVEFLVDFCDVLCESIAGLLVTESIPRSVLNAVRDCWLRMFMVMPRKLTVMTVNALRNCSGKSFLQSSGDSKCGNQKIAKCKLVSEIDIISDPVENFLMAIDSRVFRCPPLLEIALRIMEFTIVGSRSYFDRLLSEKPAEMMLSCGDSILCKKPLAKDGEVNQLRNNLLFTQDTVVVQLLLEHCLPSQADHVNKSNSEMNALREVRVIICLFVHHMFISNVRLIHAVHWQTYPSELLPMVVQGIPSLFSILDNVLLDLFTQSGDSKRCVFLFNLASHLALQYPHYTTMQLSLLFIDAVNQIMTGILSVQEQPDFCIPCLDACVNFCIAFPRLANAVIGFVLTLANHCRNQLAAMNHSVPANFRLEQTEYNNLRKNFLHLSLLDKYRFCFVKCMRVHEDIISKAVVTRKFYFSLS